jgi:hypothetical protein
MKKKSYKGLANDEGEEEIKLYKDNNLSLNKKCSSFVIILIVIASLSIILNLILFYCINLGKNIRKKKSQILLARRKI